METTKKDLELYYTGKVTRINAKGETETVTTLKMDDPEEMLWRLRAEARYNELTRAVITITPTDQFFEGGYHAERYSYGGQKTVDLYLHINDTPSWLRLQVRPDVAHVLIHTMIPITILGEMIEEDVKALRHKHRTACFTRKQIERIKEVQKIMGWKRERSIFDVIRLKRPDIDTILKAYNNARKINQ